MYSRSEDRILGGIAHLAYLLGGIGFLVAFGIYFFRREKSYFAAHHARQAVGFQLAVFVVGFLAYNLLRLHTVPFFGGPAGVLALAFWALRIVAVVAAVYAFMGRFFKYPVIGDWIPDE